MVDDQEERSCGEGAGLLAKEAALIIDPRLADLWQLIWDGPEAAAGAFGMVSLRTLAAYLRLAYAQGYGDAHSEETAGSLYIELGLPVPSPASRRSERRSRRGTALPGSSDR